MLRKIERRHINLKETLAIGTVASQIEFQEPPGRKPPMDNSPPPSSDKPQGSEIVSVFATNHLLSSQALLALCCSRSLRVSS
jgi:hypothetical protein